MCPNVPSVRQPAGTTSVSIPARGNNIRHGNTPLSGMELNAVVGAPTRPPAPVARRTRAAAVVRNTNLGSGSPSDMTEEHDLSRGRAEVLHAAKLAWTDFAWDPEPHLPFLPPESVWPLADDDFRRDLEPIEPRLFNCPATEVVQSLRWLSVQAVPKQCSLAWADCNQIVASWMLNSTTDREKTAAGALYNFLPLLLLCPPPRLTSAQTRNFIERSTVRFIRGEWTSLFSEAIKRACEAKKNQSERALKSLEHQEWLLRQRETCIANARVRAGLTTVSWNTEECRT